MSVIGLRVGPFEIVGRTNVPEPGDWHLARRTGMTRRQPHEALVRLLPPDADADSREALHHQFEILKALEDPRVPEAVAFYEGLGALALSAVHGASLHELVLGRRDDVIAMSPTTLVDICIELADTLQRAHHRNRFHGDMSPDRVLIAADGKLWIFGFGEPLGSTPHPAWVAPEVARGEGTSAATDQWHLGMLAAGLISGQTPWPTDGAATHSIGSASSVMLEPVERQWPALGRLLRRMTEPHAANRYPSMHPVRQELLALARKAGGTSSRRELGADLARPRALQIDPDGPMPSEPHASPAPPMPTASPEAPEAPPPPPERPDLPPDGFTLPGPPSAPAAELPEEEFPAPDVEMDLTISEEYDLEPQKRPQPLPDEPFVVVRPEVGTEVPLAAVTETPPPSPVAQGLGAPLSPAPQETSPEEPSPEAPLSAGVVFEPTDPDAQLSEPSDPSEAIAADSAAADVPAEGLSWDDLAQEFATGLEGGADTAVPPSDGSIEPDDLPRDDNSEETEHSAPALTGPGADASLGIGAVDLGDEPGIQGLDNDDDRLPPPALPPAVPTDTLRRIAPIALGAFGLMFVVWLLTLLF